MVLAFQEGIFLVFLLCVSRKRRGDIIIYYIRNRLYIGYIGYITSKRIQIRFRLRKIRFKHVFRISKFRIDLSH